MKAYLEYPEKEIAAPGAGTCKYKPAGSASPQPAVKRTILLASTATVMAVLILASALPALAAPPTLTVTCITPPTGFAITTSDPQEYNDLNAIYRNCRGSGGTATRVFTPTEE